MAPRKRPQEEIHAEWKAVLELLVARLKAKRLVLCLPYLPGKGRANVQAVFEPEKDESGFGERLKTELFILINTTRESQEHTTALLEGPDGVLGVIDKLEKEGCPIGDEKAFARLAARFEVRVEEDRGLRRAACGRLDAEDPPQPSPKKPKDERRQPLAAQPAAASSAPPANPCEYCAALGFARCQCGRDGWTCHENLPGCIRRPDDGPFPRSDAQWICMDPRVCPVCKLCDQWSVCEACYPQMSLVLREEDGWNENTPPGAGWKHPPLHKVESNDRGQGILRVSLDDVDGPPAVCACCPEPVQRMQHHLWHCECQGCPSYAQPAHFECKPAFAAPHVSDDNQLVDHAGRLLYTREWVPEKPSRLVPFVRLRVRGYAEL